MNGKYDKSDAIFLLINMQKKLTDSGEQRYPCRTDFCEEEVCAIKSFLGPWPRALEKSGIKPKRNDGAQNKNTEKRIRAKRRRTEAKKAAENSDESENK